MFLSRTRIVIVVASVAGVLIPTAALALMSQLVRKPTNLGARDGRLAPCPNKPNCVSTQDANRYIEPLYFTGSAEATQRLLCDVLQDLPRTRIVSTRHGYIHAESRSRILGFVDDIEFFVDEDVGIIHLRSASRVGYYDFGVNRERAEVIRNAFNRRAALGEESTPDLS